MFKYETHLHTFPVSACAVADVRETVEFYKKARYDGIFITNHFLDGNINSAAHELSYEEQIRFYFFDYRRAKQIGDEIGLKVFCGVELTYKGTDFLIYGLDEQWYLDHPEIMKMKKTEELEFMMSEGAMIIQAHPYRERGYIDHIRLFPRSVHGAEVINCGNKPGENPMAEAYAAHYGLRRFAGSDHHSAGKAKELAGVWSETPVESVEDFIKKFFNDELRVFTAENREATE